MNPFKYKHMTPYQRRRYALKDLLGLEKPTFWQQMQILWYRTMLEAHRRVQFFGDPQ